MTSEQEFKQKLIIKTIRYHLKVDHDIEVPEEAARNVAAHLQMVVPGFRDLPWEDKS